jgi:hypothetical protein
MLTYWYLKVIIHIICGAPLDKLHFSQSKL